ncbi:MAG: ATP synthase F1 subunit delta [Pseudomonadaceae bacterium]|nr:ATP synthase F1 subunit delta [Pseudomonadaceae bacterium]
MKNVSAAARYARALYQLATEGKQAPAVVQAAAGLQTVLADAELQTLLSQPLAAPLRAKLAASLSREAKLPALLADTVALMARNNRLSLLSAMLEQLQAMADADAGQVRVKVQAAAPLTQAQKDTLAAHVKQALKAKAVVVEESVQPSLLGGFRAFFGGMVWDATVSGNLARLKHRLRQTVSQTNI